MPDRCWRRLARSRRVQQSNACSCCWVRKEPPCSCMCCRTRALLSPWCRLRLPPCIFGRPIPPQVVSIESVRLHECLGAQMLFGCTRQHFSRQCLNSGTRVCLHMKCRFESGRRCPACWSLHARCVPYKAREWAVATSLLPVLRAVCLGLLLLPAHKPVAQYRCRVRLPDCCA